MNLVEKDKKFVWHPYTHQKNMASPIAIVSGKAALLKDEQGNNYIDGISSWWVTVHGHGNPYIAKKIYQQAKTLEQVIFAGFTHKPAVQLAERLLKLLPGNKNKIFYSDNGSTAVEVAVKMALQYWNNKGSNRTKIVALSNSYHGDTFGAMSASSRSIFTKAFDDKLFDVIFIDAPDQHNLQSIKDLINKNSNDIACFIYEPLVQGAGGMKMYSAEYLNELLSIFKQHHILCIADEVMTGFYRTGKMFASEYMKEQPDIMCLSKGLTGGTMALGVTACSKKIYNAFVSDDKTKTFFHGHSFTANPIACSAALASLDLFEKKNLGKKLQKIINSNSRFAETLLTGENNYKIKNIRQSGTIVAFEINSTGNDNYLNNIAEEFTPFCMKEGVFLRSLGNTIYIMPPYCITKKQLNKIYGVLDKFLSG
ncbi:adenosylmethionine--8-amino-7-oxononanoate transaminase [soil metagenome]